MSGLLGGGGSSDAANLQLVQSIKSANSQRGAALASLLQQQAELDSQNKGASARRSRGQRLLTSLSAEDKSATLG